MQDILKGYINEYACVNSILHPSQFSLVNYTAPLRTISRYAHATYKEACYISKLYSSIVIYIHRPATRSYIWWKNNISILQTYCHMLVRWDKQTYKKNDTQFLRNSKTEWTENKKSSSLVDIRRELCRLESKPESNITA